MTLLDLFLGKLHFKLTQYCVFVKTLNTPIDCIHDGFKAKDAVRPLQYVCDFCFSQHGSMGHPLPSQTQLTNTLRP